MSEEVPWLPSFFNIISSLDHSVDGYVRNNEELEQLLEAHRFGTSSFFIKRWEDITRRRKGRRRLYRTLPVGPLGTEIAKRNIRTSTELYVCEKSGFNPPPRKKQFEASELKRRRRPKPTKKVNCPAQIYIKRYLVFEDYETKGITSRQIVRNAAELAEKWNNDEDFNISEYIRVKLPLEKSHNHYLNNDECNLFKAVHPEVKKMVQYILSKGIYDHQYMKQCIESFVRTELSVTIGYIPNENDNHFYPKDLILKNIAYKYRKAHNMVDKTNPYKLGINLEKRKKKNVCNTRRKRSKKTEDKLGMIEGVLYEDEEIDVEDSFQRFNKNTFSRYVIKDDQQNNELVQTSTSTDTLSSCSSTTVKCEGIDDCSNDESSVMIENVVETTTESTHFHLLQPHQVEFHIHNQDNNDDNGYHDTQCNQDNDNGYHHNQCNQDNDDGYHNNQWCDTNQQCRKVEEEVYTQVEDQDQIDNEIHEEEDEVISNIVYDEVEDEVISNIVYDEVNNEVVSEVCNEDVFDEASTIYDQVHQHIINEEDNIIYEQVLQPVNLDDCKDDIIQVQYNHLQTSHNYSSNVSSCNKPTFQDTKVKVNHHSMDNNPSATLLAASSSEMENFKVIYLNADNNDGLVTCDSPPDLVQHKQILREKLVKDGTIHSEMRKTRKTRKTSCRVFDIKGSCETIKYNNDHLLVLAPRNYSTSINSDKMKHLIRIPHSHSNSHTNKTKLEEIRFKKRNGAFFSRKLINEIRVDKNLRFRNLIEMLYIKLCNFDISQPIDNILLTTEVVSFIKDNILDEDIFIEVLRKSRSIALPPNAPTTHRKICELISVLISTSLSEERSPLVIFSTLQSVPRQQFLARHGIDHETMFCNKLFNNITLMDQFISTQSLMSLFPSNYIDESIIKIYLNLLASENKKKDKDILIFNSDLANAWKQHCFDDEHSFYKDKDFSKKALILLPINDGKHWFLLVADGASRTVGVINSLVFSEQDNHKILRQFCTYMVARRNIIKETPIKWTEKLYEVPQQCDGSDSGVFVLMYAEQLLCGANLQTLRACHIKNYRMYVLTRLCNAGQPTQDNHSSKYEPQCEIDLCNTEHKINQNISKINITNKDDRKRSRHSKILKDEHKELQYCDKKRSKDNKTSRTKTIVSGEDN